MRRAIVLLLSVLLASPALAKTPHKEGEYGGVRPGEAPSAEPGKKKRKKPPKGMLSWVGFQAQDGGATVFLQSVEAFQVEQHVVGSTLVVDVQLTRLGANAWRPIDTRFFDSSLARIVAKRVRAGKGRRTGIQVKITFKNPQDAREGTMRSETGPDGLHYVYLSFPPGTDNSAPSTAEPES